MIETKDVSGMVHTITCIEAVRHLAGAMINLGISSKDANLSECLDAYISRLDSGGKTKLADAIDRAITKIKWLTAVNRVRRYLAAIGH